MDPFRFDELVDTWNVLCNAHQSDSPNAGRAQVERIVDATFASLGSGNDDHRRMQLQRVIDS